MRCRRVEKLLTDFVDGRLPDRTERRIRGHLERCPACRELEMSHRDAVLALDAWREVPPPEDGLNRLETRLAFAPPAPLVIRGGGLRPIAISFAAGMATAAAILLVLLLPRTTTPAAAPAGGLGGGATAPVADGAGSDLLPGERELSYVDGDGLLRRVDDPKLRRRILLSMSREDRDRLLRDRMGETAVPVDFEER